MIEKDFEYGTISSDIGYVPKENKIIFSCASMYKNAYDKVTVCAILYVKLSDVKKGILAGTYDSIKLYKEHGDGDMEIKLAKLSKGRPYDFVKNNSFDIKIDEVLGDGIKTWNKLLKSECDMSLKDLGIR